MIFYELLVIKIENHMQREGCGKQAIFAQAEPQCQVASTIGQMHLCTPVIYLQRAISLKQLTSVVSDEGNKTVSFQHTVFKILSQMPELI